MAKINPNLLLSMTSDLNDLHRIGHEMMSFDRNCEMVSWKYPNKLIKDVDIDPADIFDTCEKYILLLELIIDRLYLIMGTSTTLLDTLPCIANIFKLPKNVECSTGLSLGTVTLFFWKRLRALMLPETLLSQCVTDINQTREQFDMSSTNCGSCDVATTIVKELIDKVEELMETNALQSKITQHRSVATEHIFNMSQCTTMQLWRTAIFSDLKHVSECSNKKSSELKMMKKEVENIKVLNERNVEKLRLAQIKYNDLEKRSINDQSKVQKLMQTNYALELKYKNVTEALKLSEESCNTVEGKLQNKVKQVMADSETTVNNLKSEHLQQITAINNEKTHCVDMYTKSKQYVYELETKLKLEQEKQTESEAKLLEVCAKEKHKMEVEKRKIEEENKTLLGTLEQLQGQIKENSTKNLKSEMEIVELKRQLKVYKERELLLVRYPDLNGSLAPKSSTSKRDPFQDMEQQLVANEIRIELLHTQNASLRRTITRLKEYRTSIDV